MSAVVEKHYSPAELVFLLGFTKELWIGKAKDGVTFPRATKVFEEWRIPAGDVNAALEAGRIKAPVLEELGIAARSEGELRRKAGLKRGCVAHNGGER